MEAVLKSLKQVQGMARSSEGGETLDSAGNLDADTLSAVVAVSVGALREVGDMLSAGKLERWYLVTEQATYYSSERASERIVAVGEPLKNPEATSKAVHALK